ncbi:MAG: phenylacetic acid degradation operon negative regulatory protein PaaX [Burkholderiales bacterium]|jgi:phenylacetic acid degradation operon negative regulatory protein|nr:phenylacetic acid degradation operon negative regulatory protein PaaX [Burkholderiales bacterium]
MRNRAVQEALAEHLATRPVRAKSLVVTVFGDAIAPHGGTVWLAGLIALLAPFGINERAVRTTVFRLAAEGWLKGTQVGRRSHYGLTESGRRRFEAAFRKIYGAADPDWDGRWCVLIEAGKPLSAARRRALRDQLGWSGFGQIGASAWAHPTLEEAAAAALLDEFRARNHVVVLHATVDGGQPSAPLAAMVRDGWDLERLERDYRAFIERFRPIHRALDRARAASLDPEQCFMVRTLAIHEYRRVMLRDPLLPRALLPERWPGAAARELCRELYRLTQPETERHLVATLEAPEGALAPASPYFYARFGGLA